VLCYTNCVVQRGELCQAAAVITTSINREQAAKAEWELQIRVGCDRLSVWVSLCLPVGKETLSGGAILLDFGFGFGEGQTRLLPVEFDGGYLLAWVIRQPLNFGR
jgi:hypothetical protein